MVVCFHINIYISPPSSANSSMLCTLPSTLLFFIYSLLALVLLWSWWCNVVVIVMKFTPWHSCSILLVWIALPLFTLPNWWTLGYFSSFTTVNSAMENTFGHFKNDFSFLTSWNINLHDLTFYGEREGVGGEFPSGPGKAQQDLVLSLPCPRFSPWSRNY